MRNVITIELDREVVRQIKEMIALASKTSFDPEVRVSPEVVQAFAATALRAGVSDMLAMFRRTQAAKGADTPICQIAGEVVDQLNSEVKRV